MWLRSLPQVAIVKKPEKHTLLGWWAAALSPQPRVNAHGAVLLALDITPSIRSAAYHHAICTLNITMGSNFHVFYPHFQGTRRHTGGHPEAEFSGRPTFLTGI